MHLAGVVLALEDARGEGVAVDKQVFVGRLELVFVCQARTPEVARLSDHTGVVTGGYMVVVGAVVNRRLPVDRLDPLDRTEGLGAAVAAIEYDVEIPAGVA